VPTSLKQAIFGIVVERLVMMDTSVTRRAAHSDETLTQFDDDAADVADVYTEEPHDRQVCAHYADLCNVRASRAHARTAATNV